MKTIVYVDGFNLYYRALQGTQYKWLDLMRLCQATLPKACTISAINYYTARVSSQRSPTAPADQVAYLKALKTIPNLNIHLGNFQVTKKWMFLVQPVQLRPDSVVPASPNPDFARVVKTEEKGSDVNLGVHLVRDALRGTFEHAAVITNDTDLAEPLRIVREEAGLPVTLLTPVGNPAGTLRPLVSEIRHIQGHLGSSQFSHPVIDANGNPITKPTDW